MERLRRLSLRINPIFAAFLLIAFLSGIAGALLTPTLSLFLTTEVKVRPLWVGLFYTANAVAGIVVSFLLAKRSDTRGDRRRLILLCCLMAVGNCLLFAFNRDYLTLITAGVLMSAVANTAMPQIFALAREYADSEAREVVMFSSVMRAQLSLAWVIGPPLSFALSLNYGFTVMFLIAAATFAICVLLVGFMLPSVPRAADGDGLRDGASAPIAPASAWRNRDVRLLFIASMLMWTCNTMYIIDMPLYITADLGLPEGLAGVLMGTAAGLEIPAMLLAGYYVKRFGKRNMMLLAVAAGVLFSCPVIFYQIWRFVAPGLTGGEKSWVIPFVLCATVFFIGGAFFCYRFVLPLAFKYFIEQYETMGVNPAIRIGDYFTFFFRMVLAFGVTFELPVFTFFLVRIGLWDYHFMLRSFRYAIVVILSVGVIVAAYLLVPPGSAARVWVAGTAIIAVAVITVRVLRFIRSDRRYTDMLEREVDAYIRAAR